MNQVIVQNWTETESGQGQRPDGYTLHLTEEERLSFIDQYNERLDKWYKGRTPTEYSFPDGDAYVGDVDDGLYCNLILDHRNKKDCKHGIWGRGKELPPKHIVRTTYENENE